MCVFVCNFVMPAYEVEDPKGVYQLHAFSQAIKAIFKMFRRAGSSSRLGTIHLVPFPLFLEGLSTATTHSASFQGSSRPAAAAAPSQPAGSVDQGSKDKREAWEVGQPDYLGNASFDNILKKIDSTMSSPGKGNALIA